ncbi:MAG TPA: hypothetical protein VMF69_00975 [Gemmataceae bacterium]|nr:hypothetical protein [Gemmataceae bacterium]
MNWQHLSAFLWLRWRLQINQLKRGGIANAVILVILAVAAIVSAVVLFVVFLSVGLFLNDASPTTLMYILDGVVVAFLFLWATGLLQELQRSEALSLNKLMHLPVSLPSAFLINYLSSLASVTLLWFLSAALGLNIGLLISRGASMLLLLPMLAAFVLMVTALTYQFQGWLAALMANPRRRRTIIVAATMIFILLCQAPNMVNMLRMGRFRESLEEMTARQKQEAQEFSEANEEFQRALAQCKSNKEREEVHKKHKQRTDDISRQHETRGQEMENQNSHQMEETARLLNVVLPPGWLPAGAEAAAEGQPGFVLLAILGPALIGATSLLRSYRTTMRLYTGQYTSGSTAAIPARSASDGRSGPSLALRAGGVRASLLEKQLPWMSERAAVIALASFRSLLRAPEAKMLLLTPLLMMVIFGSMFLATAGRANAADVPEAIRPLFAFGAMVMVLFSMSQLLGNQFGLDRDGFRVFVLSPARRRDILLGKNLAAAPLAFTMGALAALAVQLVYPMRFDHLLALVPRFVSMYLLYCLPANALSILSPMRIASGSFQPARPGGIVILLQFLFMFLCPPVLALALLPSGLEWVAEAMGWRYGMPLDLIFSVLECAGIVCIYGLLLRFQGDWLHAREQRILQLVTTRAD